MSAQDASQKLLVVLAEEASKVEIVVLDRDTNATLSPATKESSKISRDGKVPWSTSILPVLKGKHVRVSQLYESIIQTYGPESISRMKTYKKIQQWVREGVCKVNEDHYGPDVEFIFASD